MSRVPDQSAGGRRRRLGLASPPSIASEPGNASAQSTVEHRVARDPATQNQVGLATVVDAGGLPADTHWRRHGTSRRRRAVASSVRILSSMIPVSGHAAKVSAMVMTAVWPRTSMAWSSRRATAGLPMMRAAQRSQAVAPDDPRLRFVDVQFGGECPAHAVSSLRLW